MTTDAQRVDDLYGQLQAQAEFAYQQYILTRTPSDLVALMATKIAGTARITNSQNILTRLWDNSTVNTPAVVTNGAIGTIIVPTVATKAIIAHNADVVVQNAANVPVAGSPGKSTVAGGVFTKVNLTV